MLIPHVRMRRGMKILVTWEKSIGPMVHFITSKKHYMLCFCHHDPERSIPFIGLEKYLCSRCMGVLFGVILGGILHVFHIRIPLPYAVLLMVPLLIDGFTQAFGLRKSNNYLRLCSGILFGMGLVFLLV